MRFLDQLFNTGRPYTVHLSWRFWGVKEIMGDLVLRRGESTLKTTPGELFQEGKHLCFTLEPPHKSDVEPICIPAGRYEIEMQWSTRWQMNTPHLLNVPGRSLIEIHPLNDEHLVIEKDGSKHWTTEGCIGPGLSRDTDWVSSSVAALKDVVIPTIEATLKQGKCFIQIIDAGSTFGENA